MQRTHGDWFISIHQQFHLSLLDSVLFHATRQQTAPVMMLANHTPCARYTSLNHCARSGLHSSTLVHRNNLYKGTVLKASDQKRQLFLSLSFSIQIN